MQRISVGFGLEELPHGANPHELRSFFLYFLHAFKKLDGLRVTVVATPKPLPEAVCSRTTVSRVAGFISSFISRNPVIASFAQHTAFPSLGAIFVCVNFAESAAPPTSRGISIPAQPAPVLTGRLASLALFPPCLVLVSARPCRRGGLLLAMRCFLVVSIMFLPGLAAAQIPGSRSVDWTHAGIPGGIPHAACFQTVSASGGADDSVAIQNAINAAPAGSVICLNAGTYTLHRASTVCQGKSDDFGSGVYEAGLCLTDKSVVLRGAGPNQTILRYGDGANVISLGRTYL